MNIRKIITAAWIITLVLLFYRNVVEADERIAVLISSQELPFEETLTGFKGYLRKHGIQADYEVMTLAPSLLMSRDT